MRTVVELMGTTVRLLTDSCESVRDKLLLEVSMHSLHVYLIQTQGEQFTKWWS